MNISYIIKILIEDMIPLYISGLSRGTKYSVDSYSSFQNIWSQDIFKLLKVVEGCLAGLMEIQIWHLSASAH